MIPKEARQLSYSVPLWSWGRYFAVAFILFTFGIMAWQPDFRLALGVGVAFSVICVALYYATGRYKLAGVNDKFPGGAQVG